MIGQALYVFGGFQDGEARGDLYKFDTRLRQLSSKVVCMKQSNVGLFKWTTIVASNAPAARCNHTMNAVGDKLYVFGGRANENIVFNDVHVFDISSMSPLYTCAPADDMQQAIRGRRQAFEAIRPRLETFTQPCSLATTR